MFNAQHLHENLFRLQVNPYPGRGLVVGLSASGTHLIQVCWIMGRSPDSRNRVYSSQGGRVFTEAADPRTMVDPSLIIYDAMDERDGYFVASNGVQTVDVVKGMHRGHSLASCLDKYRYEPDAPNFTPRITAVIDTCGTPVAQLALLRRGCDDGSCWRVFYGYQTLSPGVGYYLSTYLGDGDPLPAFRGDPLPLLLPGDLAGVTELLWSHLNPENRVAIACKFIDPVSNESQLMIINQYTKVG